MDARHLIQPGQQVCLRDQHEKRRRVGRGLGQSDRSEADQGWQGTQRHRGQLSEYLQTVQITIKDYRSTYFHPSSPAIFPELIRLAGNTSAKVFPANRSLS